MLYWLIVIILLFNFSQYQYLTFNNLYFELNKDDEWHNKNKDRIKRQKKKKNTERNDVEMNCSYLNSVCQSGFLYKASNLEDILEKETTPEVNEL